MNPSLSLPRNQVIQSFEKQFLRSQWLPRLPKTGKLLLTTSNQPEHASLSSKSWHIVNPIKYSIFPLSLSSEMCISVGLNLTRTPHPENKKCPKFHVFSLNPSLIMMIKLDVMMAVLGSNSCQSSKLLKRPVGFFSQKQKLTIPL